MTQSLSSPLDEISIEDEDDLSELALALDTVASILSEESMFSDIPDIETEPLESLLARAGELLGIDEDDLTTWTEAASELQRMAHESRYDRGVSPREIREAESHRAALVEALDRIADEFAEQ